MYALLSWVRKSLGNVNGAMVIAMSMVREMKVAIHQKIYMIPMGNGLMATSWSVNMSWFMPLASMIGRAVLGVS